VRELKGKLSAYLRQVKAGQSVDVTEHGKLIARIVPVSQSLDDRLQAMMQAGLLLWSGEELESITPVATTKGDRTVADLLVEDRE
jgi:prevent-host-death family protein